MWHDLALIHDHHLLYETLTEPIIILWSTENTEHHPDHLSVICVIYLQQRHLLSFQHVRMFMNVIFTTCRRVWRWNIIIYNKYNYVMMKMMSWSSYKKCSSFCDSVRTQCVKCAVRISLGWNTCVHTDNWLSPLRPTPLSSLWTLTDIIGTYRTNSCYTNYYFYLF